MEKKEIIGFVLIVIGLIAIVFEGIDRFEKIENGEMIVISQSQMDR